MLIVLTTTATEHEARSLSEKVIEAKLAACVQILPQMTSVYLWKGEVQKENEHLLLIKTTKEKYDELEAFILALHTYEVPEIVAIDAGRVSTTYNDWLKDTLT